MVLSRDTSPEAERVQMELLRRMSVAERLRLLEGLNELVRTVALAGIRTRFPNAAQEELEFQFARLRLGDDLALRVFRAREERGLGAQGGKAHRG